MPCQVVWSSRNLLESNPVTQNLYPQYLFITHYNQSYNNLHLPLLLSEEG